MRDFRRWTSYVLATVLVAFGVLALVSDPEPNPRPWTGRRNFTPDAAPIAGVILILGGTSLLVWKLRNRDR